MLSRDMPTSRSLGVLALALTGLAAPVQEAARGLTLVRIDGPLNVGTQALLHRAIDGAEERGDRLVVELDTPGGEVELMWQLANALLDASASGVSTIAFVHDRALSAGALLALACERVYMRSHATIGSALPVQAGPGGLLPVAEDEEVREKLSSALRGEFRGVAEKRGRSALLAEAMVDPAIEVVEVRVEGELRLVSAQEHDDLRRQAALQPVEFVRTVVAEGELLNATGSEAVALGLADGLAESRAELAAKLGVAGVAPTEVLRSRSEDLAGWLYELSPLFLVAGFVLLYLELKTPGFGLPGTLALVAFAVVLFGRHMVGLADIPHVLLLVGGAALVALELFVLPGTMWLGLAGALAILFGLIWSFTGSRIGFEYGLDRVILVEESFRVVSAGFLALLVVWGLSRLLPHTPLLSRMVLAHTPVAPSSAMPEASGARAAVARVGALGRATTALRPVGKVVLDGDPVLDFEARAEGVEIEAGSRVRVVEVQPSGRLVVSRCAQGEAEGFGRIAEGA
jgi:membrane-bound serine protease (ClpP class)